MSQDTYKGNAWEPWSQNLYSYVGNNPVRYTDPTGHFSYDATGQQATYTGPEKKSSRDYALQIAYMESLEEQAHSQRAAKKLQMEADAAKKEAYVARLTESENLKKKELIEDILVSGMCSDQTNEVLREILNTENWDAVTINSMETVYVSSDDAYKYVQKLEKRRELNGDLNGGVAGAVVGTIVGIIATAGWGLVIGIVVAAIGAGINYLTAYNEEYQPIGGTITEFDIHIQATLYNDYGVYVGMKADIRGSINRDVLTNNSINYAYFDQGHKGLQ